MTNEERAKLLTGFDPKLYELHKNSADAMDEHDKDCYEVALEMAEWKDAQYSEIIKEEYNTAYESGFSEGERLTEKRFRSWIEDKYKKSKEKSEKLDENWQINDPEDILCAQSITMIYRGILDEFFKDNKTTIPETKDIKCFAGEDGVYCKYMKSVEVDPSDEHKIVEPSETSLSCAWCTKHNCPCKDKGYSCSDIIPVKGHWDENMNWIEEEV